MNALFEAAATHVLVRKLGATSIEEQLAHLDYAHTKYGKLKMLENLSALYKEQCVILRKLAEIRNSIVHRIENVSFSLPGHINSMNSDSRKGFCRSFGHGIKHEFVVGGRTVSRDQFVADNPRLAIWLTSLEILACLNVEIEQALLADEERDLAGVQKWLSKLASQLIARQTT